MKPRLPGGEPAGKGAVVRSGGAFISFVNQNRYSALRKTRRPGSTGGGSVQRSCSLSKVKAEPSDDTVAVVVGVDFSCRCVTGPEGRGGVSSSGINCCGC